LFNFWVTSSPKKTVVQYDQRERDWQPSLPTSIEDAFCVITALNYIPFHFPHFKHSREVKNLGDKNETVQYPIMFYSLSLEDNIEFSQLCVKEWKDIKTQSDPKDIKELLGRPLLDGQPINPPLQ